MTCCEKLDILDEAIQNDELLGLLSPVSAVTFGVIPIERHGDRMRVACGETWHPGCSPFVERLLGMPIERLPFRDSVMRHYVLDAYLKEGTVNHNTFLDPGFITDLGNMALLTTDKVDDIGEVRQDLPADNVVLLHITYRSVLDNLDAQKPRGDLLCGPMDVPFRIEPDGTALLADEIDDEVVVVVRKDFFFDAQEGSGEDSYHGIQTVRLTELPYMIHPSEIQITQFAEDGTLTLYLYDRLERVRPGETKEWPMSYYFLSLGNRHSRELALRINGLTVVDRQQVTVSDQPLAWTADDLDRWLRLGQQDEM